MLHVTNVYMKLPPKITKVEGSFKIWIPKNNNTEGRVFTLSAAGLDMVPGIPYSPPSLPRLINEHRARNKTWTLTGVVQKQKNWIT